MSACPRVALVHNRYLQPGGEDVAFDAEAQLLASRGHEVLKFETSSQELLALDTVRQAAVTVWNRRRQVELGQVLERFQPDVVHFHNTFPVLSPAVYSAAPRTAAVVQTLHNYRLVCPNAQLLRHGAVCETCVGRFPWAGISNSCYRQSSAATAVVAAMVFGHRLLGSWARIDAFIALTPFARGIFARGGLPVDRVHVKPNFIDPDPGAGRHDGGNFLFVGRLDEQKGVEVLLAAWRALPERATLCVIGAGPLADAVRAAAAADPRITFLGPQPRERVLSEMRDAHALIICSLSHENFPVTLVEAFATGLPVVVSATANLASLVENGVTGWHFSPGDAVSLAAAVERSRTTSNYDSVCRAAREQYLNRHTAEASYTALRAVYGAAMQRRRAA